MLGILQTNYRQVHRNHRLMRYRLYDPYVPMCLKKHVLILDVVQPLQIYCTTILYVACPDALSKLSW